MDFFVAQPNHMVVDESRSNRDVEPGRVKNSEQLWLPPVCWYGDVVSSDERLDFGQVLFLEFIKAKLVENASLGAEALPGLDVLFYFPQN